MSPCFSCVSNSEPIHLRVVKRQVLALTLTDNLHREKNNQGMKDSIIIFSIALPFSWLSPHVLNFFKQFGLGVWLVESVALRGYWPVSIAFYVEDFVGALLMVIPYIGLVYFLVQNTKYRTAATAVFAYMLFSFLLYSQRESFTGSLYTLMQSSNVAVYVAIFLVCALLQNVKLASK